MYIILLISLKILAVKSTLSTADNRIVSEMHPSTPEPRFYTDGTFWQRIGDHSW